MLAEDAKMPAERGLFLMYKKGGKSFIHGKTLWSSPGVQLSPVERINSVDCISVSNLL